MLLKRDTRKEVSSRNLNYHTDCCTDIVVHCGLCSGDKMRPWLVVWFVNLTHFIVVFLHFCKFPVHSMSTSLSWYNVSNIEKLTIWIIMRRYRMTKHKNENVHSILHILNVVIHLVVVSSKLNLSDWKYTTRRGRIVTLIKNYLK